MLFTFYLHLFQFSVTNPEQHCVKTVHLGGQQYHHRLRKSVFVVIRIFCEVHMKKDKKVTDKVLVKQFQNGSIEAFEEIVKRYESKVFNMAMRFCRNQEDAEEVLQDVFSTIYRKIDGFQGKSAFSSWLYRIVVNASFMKLRKRKQKQTVSIEDLSPAVRNAYIERDNHIDSRSDAITLSRELRETLQNAISRLPAEYRTVFVLRDIDGLSNQEVSEILELSIPAVKSRLHRSRLMLRKKLQRYYNEYMGRPASKPMPHERRAAANC
ncbi:MAG: sigma-70 family RNA polymerase sigma factor [Candidatus Dadabacteria bacterium]|nr:MAG: sigma-70 family RNA polymerase sigma factor [Candidatus Dadabacteria bacterium]